MQYALMIYVDPTAPMGSSEDETAAITAEYMAIREDPRCLDGASLAPVEAVSTVRVQAGDAMVTDGPFADTKEVLGGYYLVDVDDLDAALEFAGRIPAARMGGAVEVWPVAFRRE
ncbi:YciI family protein [Nocardioides pocheonensis]|uniref:YCII-related domain-containing protein n=1 Tax=Nocardioides pocheonensis TaxID=661485 RepID=A0A3N0GZ04_9ACTN|nr:YciI family protein [Nocardioides pocheonensis]RNM17446.1 hypothetical protein EFL26_01260 [Nocardioides pocheonensis]